MKVALLFAATTVALSTASQAAIFCEGKNDHNTYDMIIDDQRGGFRSIRLDNGDKRYHSIICAEADTFQSKDIIHVCFETVEGTFSDATRMYSLNLMGEQSVLTITGFRQHRRGDGEANKNSAIVSVYKMSCSPL